jgi:hypothetical protein
VRRSLYQFFVLVTRNWVLYVMDITDLRHIASERNVHPITGHEGPDGE